MSTAIFNRIAKGAGANAFGQATTIVIQIISVPIYLSCWSSEYYGEWLMLSALPWILSITDGGVVAVSANLMTMQVASGKIEEAQKTFSTAISFCLFTVATLFLISSLLTWAIPIQTNEQSTRITLQFLIICSLLTITSGLHEALMRSEGNYPSAVFRINLIRLSEWGSGILALHISPRMEVVAMGMAMGRALALAIWHRECVQKSKFKWAGRKISINEVKHLIRDAASFAAIPAGNLIALQGTLLLAGSIYGSATAALFSIYRTLARSLVQLCTIFSRSAWPEISKMAGQGEWGKLRETYKTLSVSLGLASLFAGLFIYIFSENIISFWTRSSIGQDKKLLLATLTSAILTPAWQVGMVVLTATNNHRTFGPMYLLLAATSTFIFAFLSQIFGLQISNSAWALVSFDVLLIALARHQMQKIIFKIP
ncbi:hypothetical protein KGA65_16960 [Ideonella sp. B7]|uniref:lipopolysaccharide biosynthesis protein n=1 Tax=Ideonella benzenivorans TaxID=2831643 RepID=UPI001CED6FB7|nr:hypothetical protein [Ideonella benzenivorans]MCA6218226.1 hypothetical protein [Ideonella benzenivorans]